jgi:BMFP domain-containing protein YqiC
VDLIKNWLRRYSSDLEVSLPVMTEKERIKLEALQKRINELEKQLENAQMKNIALETLIDVAEENLKVPIRKKAGAKR